MDNRGRIAVDANRFGAFRSVSEEFSRILSEWANEDHLCTLVSPNDPLDSILKNDSTQSIAYFMCLVYDQDVDVKIITKGIRQQM